MLHTWGTTTAQVVFTILHPWPQTEMEHVQGEFIYAIKFSSLLVLIFVPVVAEKQEEIFNMNV